MVPDRETCLRLLDEAGCSQDVVEHVERVAALACAFAQAARDRGIQVDVDVVRAGALLHDLGRAFDHGPDHVVRGVAFLEEHDIPARVVDCVACHMGAGITPEQARAWGWPKRRYLPVAIEEQLVCHADNLTFGTSYATLSDRLEKLERQGLTNIKDRMRELHEGVAQALGCDPDEVASALAARSAQDGEPGT